MKKQKSFTPLLSLFFAVIPSLIANIAMAESGKNSPMHDYPTQARVEYVMQCMDRQGGQNYDRMYHCICAIDKIADEINYEDFSDGQLYTYLKSASGESGGLFREGEQAEGQRDKYGEAEKKAFKACFITK